MESKKCNKCCEVKEIINFHKKPKSSDGFNTICIECVKVKQKEYYLKNQNELKEKRDVYYENNKEVFIKYHNENRNKILLQQKEYRENNSEKIKILKKEYIKNNQDKVKEYRDKYYQENKDAILKKNKEWNKKNSHIVAWRSVLKSHLRRIGKNKEGKTIELLGYSALELKTHIQSLFTEGMSWDNHGEWEVDHKTPVSSFGVDTHPSIVNALSNLQPLWRNENRSKSNKIL